MRRYLQCMCTYLQFCPVVGLYQTWQCRTVVQGMPLPELDTVPAYGLLSTPSCWDASSIPFALPRVVPSPDYARLAPFVCAVPCLLEALLFCCAWVLVLGPLLASVSSCAPNTNRLPAVPFVLVWGLWSLALLAPSVPTQTSRKPPWWVMFCHSRPRTGTSRGIPPQTT